MTDLDERLAQVLRDAVPPPPRVLDATAIRSHASAGAHRRRMLAPLLAATAVVAIVAGVALAVHQTRTSGRPSADGDRRTGPVSPRAATERIVERLLAAAPTLPDATAVEHSPVAALDQPASTPASTNLIRRTRWWTASGNIAAALQFFQDNAPAGLAVGGSSSSNAPVVQALTFDAIGRQWRRPAVYTELELEVTVTRLDGGVAIRVDAMAIWLPRRVSNQRIPLSVRSVDVVVDRHGSAATVRRTLGRRDARSLATLINRLAVLTPGPRYCPMNRGFTDTLTFHAQRGDIVVRADVDGCATLTVQVNGVRRGPVLQGGRVVDRAVTRFLDLPANYGS
jgi:hypothetical protein